ncbi:hypothetical protein HDU93_004106, partial [Gonapodya sp. JEL0774]
MRIEYTYLLYNTYLHSRGFQKPAGALPLYVKATNNGNLRQATIHKHFRIGLCEPSCLRFGFLNAVPLIATGFRIKSLPLAGWRMVVFSKFRSVAAIKLQELQRQRERLNRHYDEAVADAAKETKLLSKLASLYSGIKSATFSGAPLHPAIANLENLLERAEWDPTVTDGVILGWIDSLQMEIQRGRRRAEFAWLFGKILSEWFDANSEDEQAKESGGDEEEFEDLTPNPERDAFVERLTRLAEPVPEKSFDLKVVDEAFGDLSGEFLESLQKSVQTYAKTGISSKLLSGELRAAISSILRDNLVDAKGRTALKDILASDALCNEY